MSLWIVLGLGIALVVYIVLRLAFVWYVCGGKDSGQNYYSDLEK